MEIVDKAKEMLSGHGDEAGEAVDRAADKAEEMTGGKYDDKIEAGAEKLKDSVSGSQDSAGAVSGQAEDSP